MGEQLPRVKGVKAVEGRTLEITFKDGARLPVDLSGFVARYPVLAPLGDPEVFSRAEVADWGAAVSWGGDAEMSATTLRRAAEEQRAFTAGDFSAWMGRVGVSNQEAADMLGVSLSTVKNMKTGAADVTAAIATMCRALEADPALLAAHFRPRITGRPRTIGIPGTIQHQFAPVMMGRRAQRGMFTPEWKPSGPKRGTISEAIRAGFGSKKEKTALYRDSETGASVTKDTKRARDDAQGKRGAAKPGGKRKG